MTRPYPITSPLCSAAEAELGCDMDETLLVPDPEVREMRPGVREGGGPLCQVLGEVLVHLEHRHTVFAEHGLELAVRHDLPLVLRVLELVLLDVVPDLAHHLSARQRLGTAADPPLRSDCGGASRRRLRRPA